MVEATMKTVYHIDSGASQMYPVDANAAVSTHPDEWSFEPWKPEDVSNARAAREAKYKEDYQRAEAAGQPPPPPLPLPPADLSDEQQQMLDDDAKNRVEAAARVRVRREADEKKRVEDEQYKADLALLASPPPQVDPNERRPFGRKGQMTDAERAAAEKKAAKAAKK